MNDQGRTSDAGASAVEYGLLVAAIAAVIILVVFAIGRVTSEVFDDTCDDLATQAGTTATC